MNYAEAMKAVRLLGWHGEAARLKLKKGEDWRPFYLEVIGEAGDVLVKGGVPRRKRNGGAAWDKPHDLCVVTAEEVKACEEGRE